jgi:hypothetical protein
MSGDFPGYFKSVRIDGVDVHGNFRLDRTPTRPIEVVLGVSSGVITGIVTNKQTRTRIRCDRGGVRTERQPSHNEWTDGQFRITEVPPGDFRVYALGSNQALLVAGILRWMRRDGAKGIAIHLDEGRNVTVNPTSIPAPGK